MNTQKAKADDSLTYYTGSVDALSFVGAWASMQEDIKKQDVLDMVELNIKLITEKVGETEH